MSTNEKKKVEIVIFYIVVMEYSFFSEGAVCIIKVLLLFLYT